MNALDSREVMQNIHLFAKDEKKIVSFAREYKLPMPWWSCVSILEKVTKVFSTGLLDQPFSKSVLFDPQKDLPWNNPTNCYTFANALMAQNMFKQKYVQDVHTFEQLISELK